MSSVYRESVVLCVRQTAAEPFSCVPNPRPASRRHSSRLAIWRPWNISCLLTRGRSQLKWFAIVDVHKASRYEARLKLIACWQEFYGVSMPLEKSLKVLEFFGQTSRLWEVLENDFDPWKSWKLHLVALESTGKTLLQKLATTPLYLRTVWCYIKAVLFIIINY